ncbi:MAG: 50S ribosomal protein L3 N(5)-glutamine methyltransferase [Candidatus Lightella neohaematopini]|nr:50S ribosomal protein L3 N(5)-glutamine methyltransferase [Candidatus Lightella neohaematopini]
MLLKIETKELYSILDMIRWISSKLNNSNVYYGHGTNNSWDEAFYLVFSSLNLPIDTPKEVYHAKLTSKEKDYIFNLVNFRINKRIPVPYLTNIAWYYGLELFINRNVIIPRSPIGKLIINKFSNILKFKPKYILDMCTGSGCLAILMTNIYKNILVDAIDISYDALDVAEINIHNYNLDKKITPICSDLFQVLSPNSQYDLIIANPPYISRKEINYLPKEFYYEPVVSLLSGNSSLCIIKKIISYSSKYLRKNGLLFCEIGTNKYKLIKQYPKILFNWIKIYDSNIFYLTKKQLLFYKDYFKTI